MTECYAVVGNPIGHSRSPEIHHAFAAQGSGTPLRYSRLTAEPEGLEPVVRAFFAGGGSGMNVTVPFKEAAFALADALTDRSRRAGAVNTLQPLADGSLLGENTDGIGLLADLRQNLGVEIAGRHILILGAGGAVRGILPELLLESPAAVFLANRTARRARELLDSIGAGGVDCQTGGLEDIPAGPYDVILNATSAGLHGAFPALPDALVSGSTTAYDLVYASEPTPFMQWARQRGAGCVADGLGMLVEQAAASYALWRGVHPETPPVIQQLRTGAPPSG